MGEKNKTLTYGFELLIIIVSILFASYAWFNKNKEIKTDDLKITTDAHFDLQVSLDGINWTTETTLNIDENFKFKNEITGNGINFYVSSIKRDDGTPISFKQATKNKDYLEFDVWFRLSGIAGVFLEDSSYVLPSTDKIIGTDAERISSSGNFSRDLISSSVRVSFVDNEEINNEYILSSTPSLVWAPNKNYEITCNKYCSVNLNSTNKQVYKYIDASDTNNLVERYITNLKDEIKASYENNKANGDPMLTYINSDINDTKKVTVRIWIEGNDRDNVTALTGGIFKLNLNFTAIAKQLDSSTPNVSASYDGILGFDDTMEYSIDYGTNWIKYSENNNPTFSGETVYVRKSETNEKFASNYKILDY